MSLPSKHGAAEQLDQTHRGLQITKPQGVEAQLLGHILQRDTAGIHAFNLTVLYQDVDIFFSEISSDCLGGTNPTLPVNWSNGLIVALFVFL